MKPNFTLPIILSIIFLIIPLVLPITTGELMNSISEYEMTTYSWLYKTLLTIGGLGLIVDGLFNKKVRYNLIIGILLVIVPHVSVETYRLTHNTIAILFFICNFIIISFYSKVLIKLFKYLFRFIVIFTIIMLGIGEITLFIAETIGLILMSIFMIIRGHKNKINN